jgi:hypothetical protein
MGTHHSNPERSIDERLEYLLKSSESHDEQLGKLMARIDKLAETSERHERDNERFNRVMGAALQAYLSGDTGEPQ